MVSIEMFKSKFKSKSKSKSKSELKSESKLSSNSKPKSLKSEEFDVDVDDIGPSFKSLDRRKEETELKRKNWKIFSLIAAEFSFFIAWTSYSGTNMAKILSPVFLLPLSIIPALMLFTKKNPFSFEFFGLIIAMESPRFIPSTPIFKSMMNALYYIGLQNFAQYLYSMLKPMPCPSLPLIVALFCFARVIENMRINYIGIALLTSILCYLAYPLVLGIFSFSFAKPASLILAIIAVGIAAISIYLLKRS